MDKGKVTIIGAGRSGRGMLGELYHREGYQITFADVEDQLVALLKERRAYTVEMEDLEKGGKQERRIEGFETVHANREKEKYLQILIRSDLISTALLPKDFDAVIQDLAAAVRLRRKEGIFSPLFITLGANYVGLYQYFDSRLRAILKGEDLEYFQRWICLVMSIVNRKNRLPSEQEQKGDPLRIIGDNKSVLRVEDSPVLRACPVLPAFFRLEKNLEAAMAVKIWSGNLVQCAMAFVALKDGITDTYHASCHHKAASYAYYASVEGYGAVAKEYGLGQRDDRHMVTIFRNPGFSDSLYRIVREPARKMGRNDRFIGPALCCMRHGILPYYITRCLAYGFCYSRKEEPQSMEIREMVEQQGIEEAVRHFCQLDTEVAEEKTVFDLIVAAYKDISGEDPFGNG